MSESLPKRQDVPKERMWNIDHVFSSMQAWEAAFAQVDALIPGMERFKGRVGSSALTLWEAMEATVEFNAKMHRVSLYAGMLRAGDANDQGAAALVARIAAVSARSSAATAYINPELLAIPDEKLNQYYAEEPRLEKYRHHFDRVRLIKPHVRSTEVESVLANSRILRYGPRKLFGSLVDADLRFSPVDTPTGEHHDIAQGTIGNLVEQQNRSLRAAAWESYADSYIGMKNTLACSLDQSMQGYFFEAKTRSYDTVLDSSLHPNAIPRAVFDNLIHTFKNHLPTWHRYWKLLRKAMKVDELYVYDAPLTHSPATLVSNRRHIDFAEAVDMICDGMAPLGSDYVSAMRRGLVQDRWVDLWPNQGKGSGAFSSGAPGTYPFIMMNYDFDLKSVSTLAHELGHSMHSYLTWENQPPIYSGYSLFAAETASNFNQAMVRAHLLATTTDPNFRLEILEEAFANFFRYLFVMPTLARFELDCYTKIEQGQGAGADSMSAKIVELFREAFGDTVEIDEPRLGITWAQFPHLYSGYYVYSYATGISGANALAQQVLKEDKPAADRYLEFLKSGSSQHPLDALHAAGIDMTSPAPVEAAFTVLSSLVDEFEKLVA